MNDCYHFTLVYFNTRQSPWNSKWEYNKEYKKEEKIKKTTKYNISTAAGANV